MLNSKYCGVGEGGFSFRSELVGGVLLLIATLLTIVSFSSLGIAAMFIVGGVLCSHRYMSCSVCHPHILEEEHIDSDVEIVTPVKRTVKRKPVNK